jgi:hypothetical protein
MPRGRPSVGRMPAPLPSGLWCPSLNLCEECVVDPATGTFDLLRVFGVRYASRLPHRSRS